MSWKHEFGFGKDHSSCFSVPAHSHKNKAEKSLREWEMVSLILCSTATGHCRPWTRFHCVGYYSPVLLLINLSSPYWCSQLCIANSQLGARPQHPIIHWIRKGQTTRRRVEEIVAISGSSYRNRLQGNPYSPSKHTEQKPARIFYSTAPKGLMKTPRVHLCFKGIWLPYVDIGFAWKTVALYLLGWERTVHGKNSLLK